MNGIDRIRSAILAEAETEAGRIVEAAKKAAFERVQSEKDKITRTFDLEFSAKAREVDARLERELALFRGEAGKRVLAKKNELVRRVFETAKAEILSWPRARYESLMERLVEKASGGAPGRLIVHPDDEDVFRALLERVNAGRAASGRIDVDGVDRLRQRGGFVFVGSSYEVDMRIETLIGVLELEMAPEIARELFS
ncbi:MAG TPA: V-type ATP synthase subunit E [Deltaproteobacteria bacterium]|nr:V-type ATP synthase subunit E [Deltaproteobacteria bacterium]HPP80907.1 V-type ATP synthase subunit E [Deltaproteobacteria bacterium]